MDPDTSLASSPRSPRSSNVLASRPVKPVPEQKRRPGEARPRKARRNVRKYVILRILTHFYAISLTARDIASVWWDCLPEHERVKLSYEGELARMREACARLADKRVYPGGAYLRAYRKRWNGEARYRLTKKGERVRRSISSGRRPGYTPLVEYLPNKYRDRASKVDGATKVQD